MRGRGDAGGEKTSVVDAVCGVIERFSSFSLVPAESVRRKSVVPLALSDDFECGRVNT